MNSKSFSILAVVTAVVVVAAIVQVNQARRDLTVLSADRERVFPSLAGKENAVDELRIVSGKAKFSVVRKGEDWGLKEKAGYKVSFEKVKTAIVGLAELKLLEAKTSDPTRYARLQVEAADKADAKSISVTLKGGGKILAGGVIGKRHVGLFGTGGAGTYLRPGGKAQTWLAEGEVDLGAEPNDWMIRDIVNIEAEQVRRAVIRQPDGAEIAISNSSREVRNYDVAGIPKGRKLKDPKEGKNMAGGLWRLSFEDVKPEKDIAFGESLNVAEYETFDGLKVRVEMVFIDKTVWGRFKASVVEGGDSDEKARAETKKKSDEINARAAGWAYELSPGEGEKLTTKIADILDKKKGS